MDSMLTQDNMRERTRSPEDHLPLIFSLESSEDDSRDDKIRHPRSPRHCSQYRQHIEALEAVCTRIDHKCRIHWSLSSARRRLLYVASVACLLFFASVSLIDALFQTRGFDNVSAQYNADTNCKSNSLSASSDFAVVINTFRRPKMLQESIHHYGQVCGLATGVQHVYIVWADLAQTPPSPETLWQESASLRQSSSRQSANNKAHANRSPLTILQVPKDSLNSRFLPIPDLSTTAIFMVDDDVRVDCKSLRMAFEAWKLYPDSMVGFYPRFAARPLRYNDKTTGTLSHNQAADTATNQHAVVSNNGDSKQSDKTINEWIYHSWPVVFGRQRVNLVLTKASFLHSHYLLQYSNQTEALATAVREYVDKVWNCEDVAMSMQVAHMTASNQQAATCPPAKPLYVEGHVQDRGLFGGISTGSGHMQTRARCLTDLNRLYADHGLSPPLEYSWSLSDVSWVRHAPGFTWQIRPSNVFEWFSIGNIGK
jgi:Glycosyl transferase family 64 domain